jgi:hypothetical protein
MTRRQPDEPDPWHRQWLHAAEDDITVPSGVLQVLRIYADVAELGDGRTACMSRLEMHHLTHQSYGLLQTVHEYAEGHGWLVRCPGPPKADSRRVYYSLEIGQPGKSREYKGERPKREKNPKKRSVPQIDVNLSDGSEPICTTDRSSQSVLQIDSIRTTDQSGSDQSVVRNLTLDSEIDRSSYLQPGSVPELLAQVDVTDSIIVAEVEVILQERSIKPGGYLYHLIKKGDHVPLIDEARQRIAARNAPASAGGLAQPGPADRLPSARQVRDLCPRCDQTKHDPAPCADLESTPASTLAGAGKPCAAADRCQRQHLPVPPGEMHHPVCAVIITTLHRSSAPDRASARSQDGGEAA